MTMFALSLVRPRFSGLQRQFLLLIVSVYLLTGAVALALFAWGIHGVIRQLGEEFAIQYALRQKDRLLVPIQRELALSRHLADSPLLKRWARDEEDPALKAAALAELVDILPALKDGDSWLTSEPAYDAPYGECSVQRSHRGHGPRHIHR
ncbi:MAG: hypothetical protein IT490_02970, partial [Candidatus Contendobacter sp.]|nr:hypothetical protein [Candidatus Contendobacter sp.]